MLRGPGLVVLGFLSPCRIIQVRAMRAGSNGSSGDFFLKKSTPAGKWRSRGAWGRPSRSVAVRQADPGAWDLASGVLCVCRRAMQSIGPGATVPQFGGNVAIYRNNGFLLGVSTLPATMPPGNLSTARVVEPPHTSPPLPRDTHQLSANPTLVP